MARYATLVVCAAALLATGGSALANGPPETIVLPPRTFPAVNPCTGEPHLVTIAETLRSHAFELADPARLHVNDRLTGTITTSDGFTGTIAEVGIDNGAWLSGEEESRGAFTAVVHGIARNGSGDAFSVHSVFHVTIVDGEPSVVIDRFRLECIG
jgi:hypothetical protein